MTTKAKSKKAEPKKATRPAAQPVVVDNRSRRSDEDALEGHFVDVVHGPHAGRWGAYDHTVSRDSDGYPETIAVRTRDAQNETLVVAYEDARPSVRAGGR